MTKDMSAKAGNRGATKQGKQDGSSYLEACPHESFNSAVKSLSTGTTRILAPLYSIIKRPKFKLQPGRSFKASPRGVATLRTALTEKYGVCRNGLIRWFDIFDRRRLLCCMCTPYSRTAPLLCQLYVRTPYFYQVCVSGRLGTKMWSGSWIEMAAGSPGLCCIY